jgi:hypothetical protein
MILICGIGDGGGLADHVVVQEKHAILLPKDFPLEMGGKI